MARSSSVPQVESMPGRILDLEGWLTLGFPGGLRTVTWRRARGPQVDERRTRPNPDDMLPLVAGGPDPRMDNLKQWIVNIDYHTKDESNPNRKRYVGLLEEFFRVIGRLTEGLKVQFHKVDLELGQVVLVTDDGRVPLEAVSQGTISLFGWIGVLMQRMYEVYEREERPIEQYALVLIDEIDAHMHPYLAVEVDPAAPPIFPRVQFIATTHSPLVVCNVGDGAVFRCERDESKKTLTARRQQGPPTGLGAEGLLTSDYFGLRTQLDDETQGAARQEGEVRRPQGAPEGEGQEGAGDPEPEAGRGGPAVHVRRPVLHGLPAGAGPAPEARAVSEADLHPERARATQGTYRRHPPGARRRTRAK